MTSYTEFAEKMIIALYQETERTEKHYYKFGELIDRYGIEAKESWIHRLADEWEYGFASEVSRYLGGSARGWEVRISANGMRYVEERYGDKDGVGTILEPAPYAISDVSDGRILTGPQGSTEQIEGREGDILFEYATDLLPASDRLVPLDHNSAPYREVKDGLADLYEEFRTSNDLECSPEERERLLASLKAAQRLWEATQLKIIQIKVGIIITIEDTISLLAKAGKAVGKALLIDTIKSIVRHKTGIDL